MTCKDGECKKVRLHLQPHLFAAERSRELLFHVIPSDARNPPESDKKRGDPSHSFGMTQGTGVLPRHSRKEKCLLAGAFRRSGAEPQRGEVGACHPPPVIPSEQGVSLRRGIPWQGTGCNKRGGPSRARARVFRRALLPFGMTQGGGAFSHGMTQGGRGVLPRDDAGGGGE